MLNLVLFGPPGAGKGTQADFLIAKYKLIHLSTGELLRTQIAAETELGVEAKYYMDKGFLVPDSVVIGMIKSKIQENRDAKGFVFDGFPRTVAQAKALDEMLESNNIPISGMLSLMVDKKELINRLLLRGKTSGRSDDQDVTIIENRINVYNEKTAPLINYYESQNKFYNIDGTGSIENITERLIQTTESILSTLFSSKTN
jgi:adenylate kinase